MSDEEIERVVAVTLRLAYDHWLRHGSAIRLEDAPLVALDVARAIRCADSAPEERK